jgi:hypothetical protein
MSFSDYRMATAWMEANQAQARHLAEEGAMRKQAERAGQLHRRWLSRQQHRLLRKVGAVLISFGQRLQAYGLPQAL